MGQEVRTGVTSIQRLRPYLPPTWVEALLGLSENIQELRLRADAPVTVSLSQGEWFLTPCGLSRIHQPDVFFCSRRQLESCFFAFCDHSVYAHQWELQQGYIAVSGGIRVGVAGTAVTRDGGVCSVQNITALCIRLPRQVAGCARPLLPLIGEGDTLRSALLIGPPACGKTTLLRDLAARLATRHRRVAVVDERGELSLGHALGGCDVLRGYPKAVGIRQAVRCLAPDVILLDELGDGAERQAVADCAHSGVAVVATLHGYSPWEMGGQPFIRDLIGRRVFSRWIFLQGRENPGQIRDIYIPEVTPDGVDWRTVDDGCGDGDGAVCLSLSASSRGVFGDLRTGSASTVAGDAVYGTAYGRSVAAVGGL